MSRPASSRPGDGGEDGFTVVEVLVSFAIAALGMLLAVQIAGDTMAGLRRAAVLHGEADEAESICLRRLAGGPLRTELVEGHFTNGQTWTLRVSDVRAALPSPKGPALWRMVLTRGGPDGLAIYTTLIPDKPDA